MPHAHINWLTVLAAAGCTFLIGGVWYGALFARAWKRLNGYGDEDLARMKSRRPPAVFFGLMVVCYVVFAAALAHIIPLAHVQSAGAGIHAGLVMWVVAVAVQATGHIASGKPWGALVLDSACQLVYFPVTGAILASWR